MRGTRKETMAKEKLYDHTINLRLPAEMAKQAQAKAAREKRPLAEILRELLRAWLADKPTQAA
jgi:hypothetical protein